MRAGLAGATLSAAISSIALAAIAPSPAHAQSIGGIALDQLEPSPAGDAFVGLPSAATSGHLVPRGVVLFDYAHRPLELRAGDDAGAVVSGQGILHLGASFALWERLLVSASVPLALAQSGDDPTLGGVAAPSPSSAEIGDLRLGVRVRVFGEDGSPLQVGLGMYLHLPTGASDSFVGEGAVRDSPHLAVGGRWESLVYGATLGAVVRGSDNPSSLTYGAGAAIVLLDGALQVGPEVYAATDLQDGSIRVSDSQTIARDVKTNAEVLLDARVRPLPGLLSSLVVRAAGGPGLSQAIGTPAFRVAFGLAWDPESEASRARSTTDSDADGVLDEADACRFVFGVASADAAKNGCAVIDGDGDGIADDVDGCPAAAGPARGPASADAKLHGCPPDRDGDGVTDAVDLCPDTAGSAAHDGCTGDADTDKDGVLDASDACPHDAGVTSPDVKLHGCPKRADADTDGDAVLDTNDACPEEKGKASPDAKKSGCPLHVRVEKDRIVTLSPIELKTRGGKPVVDAASEAVLLDVRDVLAQHPEIRTLEIGAHTDATGDAKYNETISQQRADAVRAWLIGKGVAEAKLVAKGYGPGKPVADNATAAGRAKNRRIDLVVTERR